MLMYIFNNLYVPNLDQRDYIQLEKMKLKSQSFHNFLVFCFLEFIIKFYF